MHNDADMSAETSDADGRWLTYDQLATLRRIDKPSAVKLATRNHWRRRKGNTGQMQVCVPVHWFERAQDRADRYTDKSTDRYADKADIGTDTSLQAGALAALEDAVAALREQLDVANARAERAEADRADERQRADTLRDRLNGMQEQLADAHAALQAAESADARAKQAERDRERAEAGWDAERGRAGALRAQIDELNAEMVVARAEAAAHAEAARAEERQRADAINALLEATQEELAGQRELTDQTRANAERAHAEAEVLRQADAERKARGLVARLRAAWRSK